MLNVRLLSSLIFFGTMTVGLTANACVAPPHHFPYSPPRLASQWKKYTTMLTAGQQQVVAAVLNAPDSVYTKSGYENRDDLYGVTPKRDHLYFALLGGVLVLYFANPKFPTAEYPVDWPNCPVAGGGDCRGSVHIIGSTHLYYFPSCHGGPGNTPLDGQRLAPFVAGESDELDPIDIVARKAYKQSGVPAPWEQSNEFWLRASAK